MDTQEMRKAMAKVILDRNTFRCWILSDTHANGPCKACTREAKALVDALMSIIDEHVQDVHRSAWDEGYDAGVIEQQEQIELLELEERERS